MTEKERAIRGEIDSRRQQIADGVSLENKERMEQEIKGFEEELANILAEQRLTEQEQKIAEVDEMELPFDIDTDFGTVGVNAIVRKLLKGERTNNFAEFNVEYERINAEADEKVNGALEREIQLKRQNEELQETADKLAGIATEAGKQIARLAEENAELRESNRDLENRIGEVEQNRQNAATQLEEARIEIERLEGHIDDLRNQIGLGERQAQRVIDVSPSLNDAYEQAKQATAEKRKVMVTAELGLYREVLGEDGKTEIIRHSDLEGMEQVDSFPELPLPDLQVEGAAESVEQFREKDSGIPEIQQGAEQGNSGDPATPVGTLEEAFRRIGALEQAVFKQGAA